MTERDQAEQEQSTAPTTPDLPTAAEAEKASFGKRVALSIGAIVAPLVLVGAVAAATGSDSPGEPVESQAATLEVTETVESEALEAESFAAIGGQSGETRDDYDNRSETAGDVGQPGSCPGGACEAPGLNGLEGESEEEATPPADEPALTEVEATDTPEEEVTEEVDPHANGKGCDDKLFAGGSPPFGGPGGPKFETPVGPCNGEDDPGEEELDEPAAEIEEEGEPGSNGLGLGHVNGRGLGHEIGNGMGHEKDGESGEVAAPEQATGPGNGKAKGKNK